MKLPMLVCLGLAFTSCSATQTPPEQVNDYLRRNLSNSKLGVAYRAYLSKPVLIDAPILARFLPHTSFYLTKVAGLAEYPEVDALVAVQGTAAKNRYTYCVATDYDVMRPEFLALFRGVHAETFSDRQEVSNAIITLFAKISPDCRAKTMHYNRSFIEAKLRCGEYGTGPKIRITFDVSGTIESVTVV